MKSAHGSEVSRTSITRVPAVGGDLEQVISRPESIIRASLFKRFTAGRVRGRGSVVGLLSLVVLGLGPGQARAASGEDGTAQTGSPAQSLPRRDAPASDEPRALGEFLVIARNGERIEGHGGRLTATRFTGISERGQPLDLPPEEITTLYRKEGSRAGVMALYGAGAGLVISGAVVLKTSLDAPELFRDDNALRVSLVAMGGSTLLGALIGLAIGAGQSHWSVQPLVAPGQQYSLLLSRSL